MCPPDFRENSDVLPGQKQLMQLVLREKKNKLHRIERTPNRFGNAHQDSETT